MPEICYSGVTSVENCKDVDVVSEIPESSNPATFNSLNSAETHNIVKNYSRNSSRSESSVGNSTDSDDGVENASGHSSVFEFQKAGRVPQRVPPAPLSKQPPSKWDDAQKWIAGPSPNRPKGGLVGQSTGSRKPNHVGYGSRQASLKVAIEVPDQRIIPYEEPDTKRIDWNLAKKENGVPKFVSWEANPFLNDESFGKPVVMIENVKESAISLSRHDSSVSIQSATAFIPPSSTARSVSLRDMGTEMTPIASQEPSRTGTPIGATTPSRSPNSSRPSTPGRAEPVLINPPNDHLDSNRADLSEIELQMKTRREIMALGTQLGKMNIAAWASKADEDGNASSSLKSIGAEEPARSVIEIRATAWEEAEKAKYMARFKREEIKIQAWENHQKAKTEAEMKKIEVEVERMRSRAHDKLMTKLAAVRHKAEEKRAAAEAKRDRHAEETEKQAEYIRRTGRLPSSFSCFRWCF